MAGTVIAHLRRRIAEIEGRLQREMRLKLDACAPAPGSTLPVAGKGGRRRHASSSVIAAGTDERDPIAPSCEDGSGRFGSWPETSRVPFGISGLDRMLAGGLNRAALHEVRTDETREAGAAQGFTLALAAHLLSRRRGDLLWVQDRRAGQETGLLYGPGLAAYGFDPARLLSVRVDKPVDALWALEEGLRSPAIAVAVAEIHGSAPAIDLTATRRLSLKARARERTALFLRLATPAEPSAAVTRWRVAARPSVALNDFAAGLGRPAFVLELEKNRDGPTGLLELEWVPHVGRFKTLDSLSGAVAAASSDRPPAPVAGGSVVALRHAS